MKRWKTLILASLAAFALNTGTPARALLDLPVDNRMKLLAYSPNDIYTIVTRVGYQTNIEFGQHEEVETISVGDRSFWQIIPSGNRLFIRPIQDDVSTNMTVITNRRAYQFDLKSSSSKTAEITYVARFDYPDDKPKLLPAMADPFNYANTVAAAPMPPAPQIIAQEPISNVPFSTGPSRPAPSEPGTYRNPEPVKLSRDADVDNAPAPVRKSSSTPYEKPSRDAANRNYRYSFSGPEDAAPYEVYDDGHATYFRYRPPIRTAPEVYVREGTEERKLEVFEKGGFFAVESVSSVLTLKRGDTTVGVYNETLSSGR